MRVQAGGRSPRFAVAVAGLLAALTLGWFVASRIVHASLVDGPVARATLVWHPGVNSGGPEVGTTARGEDASRLVDLINNTTRPPSGPVNCPADTGSGVDVTFLGKGERRQRVAIALTGCAGPAGRMMSESLRDQLRRLAPPGFWPGRLQ